MKNPLMEQRDYDGRNQLDKNKEEIKKVSDEKIIKDIVAESLKNK